jgi:hypothetical protein
MEMGAFSISLAQTGRMPDRTAASGKTPIPSKRLLSVISLMFSLLFWHRKRRLWSFYKKRRSIVAIQMVVRVC